MTFYMKIKQLFAGSQYLKHLHSTQVRTTFILKRQRKPPITNFTSLKPYAPSKTDHFIYDLVEDTDLLPQPDISVILLTFVEGYGQAGDVVSVPPTFARKNLFLQRKAVYASPDNLKEFAHMKGAADEKYSSHTIPMTIRMLATKIVSIPMSFQEPWTLEPWHVALGMRLSNISVTTDMVKIPNSIKGPDVAIQNKDFYVYVVVNKTEHVPVRCRIHYLGQDVNRDWMYIEEEPVFSEQADVLKTLPLPKKELSSTRK